MSRASSVPYLAKLPGIQSLQQSLCTAHLFTLGLAYVLVCSSSHVGSSSNPLRCICMIISLAVEAIAGCCWSALGAFRPRCLLRRPPSLGHSRVRLLSCLLLLWLLLLMRGQALVQNVHAACRLPFLFWRHCCVSSSHFPLPRNLADAALRCLAANSQEYPPRARRRWSSLWCWSTACTIFCGSLCPPIVDSSDC